MKITLRLTEIELFPEYSNQKGKLITFRWLCIDFKWLKNKNK